MKLLSACITTFAVLSFSLAAFAAPPDKGLYKTQLDGTLEKGKDGTLTLKVLPAKGYKWNKEYPAKLELADGTKVAFAQKTYKKVKGEIKGDDKSGQVAIKASGRNAGEETVEATFSFSICSEETCHVLRKRKIPLKVTVR